MSLVLIKDIFAGIGTYDAWSLQLIKINNSKRNGTSYIRNDSCWNKEVWVQGG